MTTPSDTPPRRLGRPRNLHADDAILAAAEGLLRDGGADAVTMNAVVARSGVSRATVYRRWPNRDALVAAVFRRAMGRAPLEPHGNAIDALGQAVDMLQEVLARQPVRDLIPEMMRMVLADSDAGPAAFANAIPGHARLAAAVGRTARETGLRDDVDPELVADLVVGGLLFSLLRTGRGPDRARAAAVLSIVVDGLRLRPGTSG